MPETNEEKVTFVCPHCNEEIDELKYSAEFSVSNYGKSYGTYSFSGEEDFQGCADRDHKCEEENNEDSDNWEEDNYTYRCPECDWIVSPMECIRRGTEEEQPERIFKFKIDEMVIVTTRIQTETEEVTGKVVRKRYDASKQENVYTIELKSEILTNREILYTESNIRKWGTRADEWMYTIEYNKNTLISNRQPAGTTMQETSICQHCNYAFVTSNRTQYEEMNQCPQCNSIISQNYAQTAL